MKQFFRFLTVGVFNTLLGYSIIFACMYLAKMTPEISNITGYAVGLVTSYVLNRTYTFKSQQSRDTELVRFLIVFAIAYGLNFATLLILIHKLGLNSGLSQVLAGVVYVGISFVMNKYYVFKGSNSSFKQHDLFKNIFYYNQHMEVQLKQKSVISHQYCLIVFCIGSLYAILTMVLSIDGLTAIDDHRLIQTIFQGNSFGFYINPVLGRFFPLTTQEYILASKIFGPSSYLFQVISGIKVLLCGTLLFYCLILTKANNWTIAILWGTAIFSIDFANAAFRLHVGEFNAFLLILVFIWSTLVSEKLTFPYSSKQKIVMFVGVVALAIAFFYKEMIFVFALVFGASELLRYYRQNQTTIPYRIWAILVIGISYIVFYVSWRIIYSTGNGSYASLHAISFFDVLSYYANNDPFIVFIVLPLTSIRVLLVIYDANKQTVYDSLLIAASAYVGGFLVLRMHNPYYLLPAYSFAVCGLAGILVTQTTIWFNTTVLVVVFFLEANTLPVAISDMQALKSMANNHYQFVHFLSKWLSMNPLPNFEHRNLILEGVDPSSGMEVILSLKAFIESLDEQNSYFEIKTTESFEGNATSLFYGTKHEPKYIPKIGDLLIYNPYQQMPKHPPLLAPSYRDVYRSESEWVIPRLEGWRWLVICIQHDCSSSIYENSRYTGYAAMLVHRLAAPIQLIPLKFPSYRVGSLKLASRMRAGIIRRVDVFIENTGKETWPADDGVNSNGMFTNLSYVWISDNGQIALEGGRVSFPDSMQPNDKAKVSMLLKTPTKPGKYKLVISPVQEGVQWFYPHNNINIGKEIELF